MPHSLVIGGSGMLAGLVRSLTTRYSTVSVIARDSGKLSMLSADASGPGTIEELALDYGRDKDLTSALCKSQELHGPIDVTFAWVHHSSAPRAIAVAAGQVQGTFFHILGSAFGNPANPSLLSKWVSVVLSVNPNLDYRQIILGFVAEDEKRSRWLRNDEISTGCAAALESAGSLLVVGTVNPWSRRRASGKKLAVFNGGGRVSGHILGTQYLNRSGGKISQASGDTVPN